MYQPEAYVPSLLFMLSSMICWGSWANTLKLCPQFRFQLFYWDYVLGMIGGAVLWAVTLGSMGSTGASAFADLAHASGGAVLFALGGGAIFNVANLLLVAAIDIAGLAVAFPIGIGLALVIGAVSNYFVSPNGNPFLLFGGIALVAAAIVLDAIAYRLREATHRATSRRGIVISLISGVLMGTFYPLVSKSMTGPHALGPYAALILFSLGVAACSLPANYLLMRSPLDASAPARMNGYFHAKASWHLSGLLGGAIWGTGAMANFVASRVHIVGPAVSYSIGQGATMVSACWGVFVWKEFASAPRVSKVSLAWMFLFFVIGLLLIALAPVFQG
ncbi:MAG TPA: AcrB/AcrD/AcrF family protein [Terracidiphilus sp.]|jgi:glucose uptake protein